LVNESAAQKLAGPVLELLDRGADRDGIAAAAVVTWRAIAATLTPIIGPLGFLALYGRAVKLAGAEHGWLSGADGLGIDAPAFPALHAALSQQPVAAAAAAHASLLNAFCGALSSLIGAALTERLLCTVWDPPSSGTSAEPTP
jgi:hypothetical protein